MAGYLAQAIGRYVACQDNSGDCALDLFLQLGDDLEPIKALRQVIVGDNQVRHGRPLGRQLQRPVSIRGDHGAMTLVVKKQLEQFAHSRIVFDDQDCAAGWCADLRLVLVRKPAGLPPQLDLTVPRSRTPSPRPHVSERRSRARASRRGTARPSPLLRSSVSHGSKHRACRKRTRPRMGEPEVADHGLAALNQGAGAAWGIDKRLPKRPTGREIRRVAGIEAPALTASQTRKVPTSQRRRLIFGRGGDEVWVAQSGGAWLSSTSRIFGGWHHRAWTRNASRLPSSQLPGGVFPLRVARAGWSTAITASTSRKVDR